MIEWVDQATRQLDQAHDYIALSNSEEVAARITMRIVASVQRLAAFLRQEERDECRARAS
jgi:plasmid stabilization system protein ParE